MSNWEKAFRRPTPLQRFFVTPYSPFTGANKDLELYKLSKGSFATTFAQLMNTYWLAGINLGQTTNGLPPEDEILTKDLQRNMTVVEQQLYNTTNATESLPYQWSRHNGCGLLQFSLPLVPCSWPASSVSCSKLRERPPISRSTYLHLPVTIPLYDSR